MSRSVHFDWYTRESEQDLLYDLVAEAVHVNGHDMFYVPRTVQNRDDVFSEAEWHEFNDAFMLEFYVKTTSQMGGEGALLSKFGVELRDEMVVTVAMKTFSEEVLTERPEFLRPREGDAIYVPMIGSLFTVKYVDKKAFFYQLGGLQAYDLSLELYEGSSAVFSTGVPEIDSVYSKITEDIYELALLTEDGHVLSDERDGWALVYETYDSHDDHSQNLEFEDTSETVIDWTEADPFSEGGKY